MVWRRQPYTEDTRRRGAMQQQACLRIEAGRHAGSGSSMRNSTRRGSAATTFHPAVCATATVLRHVRLFHPSKHSNEGRRTAQEGW